MQFRRTIAINKLLKLTKRKRIIQGGTWAGKTFGIDSVLINDSIVIPNLKTTIVAETIPAVKHGALSNFQDIMRDTNRWFDKLYNATERIYTFPNNSSMQFTSFESVGKAHAAGKRNNLFINEANYIPFEIADALMMRTEGTIWIDYNPTEEFWAHTEMLTQEDSEFLLLKYTDNECLPESIHKELMMKLEKAKTSSYWRNWCKVYIDGEIGTLEGIIFPEIKIVSEMPKEYKWMLYGLDFGFTNDPSVLVKIIFSNGELFFQEIFYKTGLTNSDISALLRSNGISPATEIIADSSEPKSIEDLRRMGWNVRGAVKGKDSIKAGIDLMKQYRLNITAQSLNMIKEFRNYKWKIDNATGRAINEPEDINNHFADAARYGCMYKFSKPILTGAPRALTTFRR